MDLIPTNIQTTIDLALRILIFAVGLVIFGVSYFQAKEAKKMERKLSIAFPGSVRLAISMHMLFATVFLFISVLLLLTI